MSHFRLMFHCGIMGVFFSFLSSIRYLGHCAAEPVNDDIWWWFFSSLYASLNGIKYYFLLFTYILFHVGNINRLSNAVAHIFLDCGNVSIACGKKFGCRLPEKYTTGNLICLGSVQVPIWWFACLNDGEWLNKKMNFLIVNFLCFRLSKRYVVPEKERLHAHWHRFLTKIWKHSSIILNIIWYIYWMSTKANHYQHFWMICMFIE